MGLHVQFRQTIVSLPQHRWTSARYTPVFSIVLKRGNVKPSDITPPQLVLFIEMFWSATFILAQEAEIKWCGPYIDSSDPAHGFAAVWTVIRIHRHRCWPVRNMTRLLCQHMLGFVIIDTHVN